MPKKERPPAIDSDEVSKMYEEMESHDDSVIGDQKLKETLKKIGKLVVEVQKADAIVAKAEATLKDAQGRRSKLVSQDIPDFMDECGLTGVEMEDGAMVTIKEDIKAGVTKAKKDEAFKWLREQGHGDIIKNQVVVSFDQGQDKIRELLLKTLKKKSLTYEIKEAIHWQTLRAFCKERIEDADDQFSEELFGVYHVREAKIK